MTEPGPSRGRRRQGGAARVALHTYIHTYRLLPDRHILPCHSGRPQRLYFKPVRVTLSTKGLPHSRGTGVLQPQAPGPASESAGRGGDGGGFSLAARDRGMRVAAGSTERDAGQEDLMPSHAQRAGHDDPCFVGSSAHLPAMSRGRRRGKKALIKALSLRAPIELCAAHLPPRSRPWPLPKPEPLPRPRPDATNEDPKVLVAPSLYRWFP